MIRITKYVCLFLLVLTGSCKNTFKDQKLVIQIVNELQACEEINLHYSIVKVLEGGNKNLQGKIVLPILDKNINNVENNDLLFPAKTMYRYRFTVEGYYSKERHKSASDGCLGAHAFMITNFQDKEIVDSLYNYPINNQ